MSSSIHAELYGKKCERQSFLSLQQAEVFAKEVDYLAGRFTVVSNGTGKHHHVLVNCKNGWQGTEKSYLTGNYYFINQPTRAPGIFEVVYYFKKASDEVNRADELIAKRQIRAHLDDKYRELCPNTDIASGRGSR